MSEEIIYQSPSSTIYKAGRGEYQIIRKITPRHAYDSDIEEFWVEVRSAGGLNYLNIDSDIIKASTVWPETAVNNGWLSYEEICALPVHFSEQCEACHQMIELRDLHPDSAPIPTDGSEWEAHHYDCESDTRAIILF